MKFSLKQYLTHAELTPEERREVLEDLLVFGKHNRRQFLIRMAVLMTLSTVIATAGLLSDSAAVVIGAMLVAPMMNPVMGAAGSVVMGWSSRFYRSILLVLTMGLGAVLLSMAITALSPEIVFLPEQVLARTRPTFYDLLIALAAGSAGAYTITHKESGAIPGVAVAVALLPPLASAGVLIVALEMELAVRALVLFLTNLIAMVLAAALTFMAAGVSPASARRRSASFIKSQLWLFALLMIAVSIPLYFYSQKVIFDAEYKAAKSELLQSWLRENNLTLTGIDFRVEERIIFLELEGPNPPVGIRDLYERAKERAYVKNLDGDFALKYSWTQKVDGSWPIKSDEITEVALSDSKQENILLSNFWEWEFTQYDSERGAKPPADDSYIVSFEDRGKVRVTAACGSKTGKYTLRGRSIQVEMKRLDWFGCRKDKKLQVFFGDLQRGSEFFISDGRLQITLTTDSGIIYFKKR
ncbi:MAG: TIGR00341 family protein [Xanthomonadales bacterium]|nr:TIGR00341 family protein [Xanthomonadales bacterium]